MFEEKYKYKESKRKEQMEENREQCKDASAGHTIVVKASNPKKKISTIVGIIKNHLYYL